MECLKATRREGEISRGEKRTKKEGGGKEVTTIISEEQMRGNNSITCVSKMQNNSLRVCISSTVLH